VGEVRGVIHTYLTPAYPYSPENRTSTRRHHPRPGAGGLDADFLRLGIFVFAVIITSHLTQIASERGSSCIQILMAQQQALMLNLTPMGNSNREISRSVERVSCKTQPPLPSTTFSDLRNCVWAQGHGLSAWPYWSN
jgi:hypothetical protein